MIIPNVALRRLREGDVALGFGVTHIRSVAIAHIARAAGYQWLTIDLEHGVATLDEVAQLCMAASAAGIAPIVRVGAGAYTDGTRLLDNGAQGVLMADVRSAEQARRMVEVFRYPPQGKRPWGANAFPFGYRPPPTGEAMHLVNNELLLAVMVESAEAVADIDAIAATPGIDVVFVGASDLSTNLGTPGQFGEKPVRDAIERVAAACQRAGKVLGLGGIYDAVWLPHYAARGARFIAGGNDHGFVLAGATDRARLLAKTIAESRT
jgi:2-keto-3-deoxy-L-rhamnonate aldolase RhmA